MYYQIDAADENNIVGKGFYVEDTFLIPNPYNYQQFSDSLDKLPIDVKEFNKALKGFDYVYLDKIIERYRYLLSNH